MEKTRFQLLMQRHKYLTHMLIGLVGIIMVISAFLVKEDNGWQVVLSGIGSSILASSIVSVFIFALIPEDMRSEMERWGLVRIHEPRSNAAILNSVRPREQLDLIAADPLSILNGTTEKVIADAIKQKRGLRIRILTPSVYMRCLSPGQHSDQLKGAMNEIQLLNNWKNNVLMRLDEGQKECIEIRYYDEYPMDFYCRIDGRIFTGPYSSGRTEDYSITYQFMSDTEGGRHYTELFEDLWTGSHGFHIAENGYNFKYIDISGGIRRIIEYFCQKVKEESLASVHGVVAIYKEGLRRTFYSYKPNKTEKNSCYRIDLGTIGLMMDLNKGSPVKTAVFSDYKNQLHFEMSDRRGEFVIKKIGKKKIDALKKFSGRDTKGLLAVPLYWNNEIIGAFTFDFSKFPESYRKTTEELKEIHEGKAVRNHPELERIFVLGNDCANMIIPLLGYGLDSDYYKLYTEKWEEKQQG